MAPLTLPLGVKYQEVVDDVLEQINQIFDRAEGCTPTVTVSGVTPEMADQGLDHPAEA
jgi:hypothetical protein